MSDKKKTKRAFVINRLKRFKYITRNLCLNNRITRLSDIIFRLKDRGWLFETCSCTTNYNGFYEEDFKYTVTNFGIDEARNND